jgi:glycosyltransferase involved in cell wall biosynthesis
LAVSAIQVGRPLRIGLYSPYFGATFGGGEKYLVRTAWALRDAFPMHQVELLGPVPADRDRYATLLNLDLAGIRLIATNPHVTPVHRLLNRLTPLRPLRNLVLSRQAGRLTVGYDLFVTMAYAIPVECRAAIGVILCQFPYRLQTGRELDGYQLVVAQSEYVRRWVGQYWRRDAVVVNPPIDVPAAAPEVSAKQPIILSVGRFIGQGHTKRQDLMVNSFRRLLTDGLDGWELHLAGSVHHDAMHRGYFDRVVQLTRGLPVHVHPDAPYTELQDLYRRASIYWHAAGYGADADTDPAALEHFGMTTAEAMAHGVVPVAIARGGQLEVVQHGTNGFLWQTPEELEAYTLQLVADTTLRRRLGKAARAWSRRFSADRFNAEIVTALRGLVDKASSA